MKQRNNMVLPLAGLLFACSSFLVNAADDLKPSVKEVKAIVKMCKEDAADDEIEASQLTQYLTVCINDELEANDFKALDDKEIMVLIKGK
ncbi:MAG: hypothetical protein ACSHW0_09330 [Thalassotalea sp.]